MLRRPCLRLGFCSWAHKLTCHTISSLGYCRNVGHRDALHSRRHRYEAAFEARQAELKDDGKAGRWLSPLAVHIIPAIGSVAIEDVDQHLLKRVLELIWHEKPDTARKAVNRLNLTLKHAVALGLDFDLDLQATMKARALLGKQRHMAQHVPSTPYPEAPAFYQMLGTRPYQSYLALRFLMLGMSQMAR